MKIKKGDNIIVIAGKDRGKSGTILRAYPKKDRVLIEGINVVKRHQKARRQGQVGQIVERPLSIHVSNVAVTDKAGKPTRVGYDVTGGIKVRIMKKTGAKV